MTDSIYQDQKDFSDKNDEHPGRGRCLDCGGWIAIAGLGMVKPHDGGLLGLAGECPGSARPPAEPVPCRRCGRTWIGLPSLGLCTACARLGRVARRGGRYVTGVCAVCGGRVQLRGDGMVCGHYVGARNDESCPGEGQPPAGVAAS
jgi:hypothetical protein